MGLSSPTKQERDWIWAHLSVPEAGIYARDGGYKPFKLALRAHDHVARTKLITGGIRSSKSLGAAMEAVSWLPHADLIWLAGDTYDLSRQEFDYIADACLSLNWVTKKNISQPKTRSLPASLVTRWGTRVESRSLHDVNTFVARAPDVIVICEPGLADPRVVVKATERLSTRRGLLWMAGTFEEVRSNWMEDFWKKWIRWPNNDNAKSFTIPTWHNTVTYPGGKNDPEIQLLRNRMSEVEFLLRCGGVPVPAPNLVMSDVWGAKQRKKLIRDYQFRETDHAGDLVPVYLALDPGYATGKYVVEAIQVEEIKGVSYTRVFDEIALETETHESVIEHCRAKPWWPNVSGGTTDPHAEAHIHGAATTSEVWWRTARVKLEIPPRLLVPDTLGRLKAVMNPPDDIPLVSFSPHLERLFYEIGHWRRKQSREGYGEPQKHNCDAIKALAYFFSQKHRRGGELRDIVRVTDYSFS